MIGANIAIVTPTMALVTVGRHSMKAVPSTSRGTPAATYMAASGHQRRSPWRMPAWPPMIESGTTQTPTSTAVGRLSSRSTRWTSGAASTSTAPSTSAPR